MTIDEQLAFLRKGAVEIIRTVVIRKLRAFQQNEMSATRATSR